MNKNVLIGLGILVLVAGGYYYVNQHDDHHDDHEVEMAPEVKNSETPQNTMEVVPSGTVHQIDYTDEGFAPKITIKAGDQVAFTNKSSEALLVTFGEHENHDEAPDGKDHPMIAKGMTDTVIFPEAGTFEFHNHYLDEHTGEVEVK